MPLESATYISDLNTSNPVGSTDKVQTLDDHVRLIKSTLKTTFPNVTGAMTASHTELNILDGATLSTAELNILDGVTLTAAQINDAALKSAANTFTATGLGLGTSALAISAASPWLVINETDQGADAKRWYFGASGGALSFGTLNDAESAGADWLSVSRSGATVGTIALAGTAITLNGVNITDYARLSQQNIFTGSTDGQRVQVSKNTSTGTAAYAEFQLDAGNLGRLVLAGTNFSGAFWTSGPSGSQMLVGSHNSIPLVLGTAANARYVIDASGNHDFKSGTATFGGTVAITGAVTAATIANSTSETLVAGQLHFIDANATLPNLTAGQWIQVVNDSASPITISKNGSDTTYWATTGATVSTSFTLAARGVLTARCNPAGSAVYVTGSGITGAS